jgi:hypothetical protein
LAKNRVPLQVQENPQEGLTVTKYHAARQVKNHAALQVKNHAALQVKHRAALQVKYLATLQRRYQEKYQSQRHMVISVPSHRLHLPRRNFRAAFQAQNCHALPRQEVFAILPPVFHLVLIDWTTMMLNERDTTALGRLSASWLTSRKTLQNPRCDVTMSFGREKPNASVNSPISKPNGTVNLRTVQQGEMKWSRHSHRSRLPVRRCLGTC